MFAMLLAIALVLWASLKLLFNIYNDHKCEWQCKWCPFIVERARFLLSIVGKLVHLHLPTRGRRVRHHPPAEAFYADELRVIRGTSKIRSFAVRSPAKFRLENRCTELSQMGYFSQIPFIGDFSAVRFVSGSCSFHT